MKTTTKVELWIVGATIFIAAIVMMNMTKGESEWKPGEPWEKAVRQMQERAAKRARENPPPPPAPPRVWTPEERIESSVRRTESMVRDIESKQRMMEMEQEWERSTRHWNLR